MMKSKDCSKSDQCKKSQKGRGEKQTGRRDMSFKEYLDFLDEYLSMFKLVQQASIPPVELHITNNFRFSSLLEPITFNVTSHFST